MKINYAPYLKANSNGMIWWHVDDAGKLVAGYRPICSDAMPDVILRAPSNEVVANHRSLISARLQDIPNVTMPRLVEDGGAFYVEASEYLGWFAQYLAHSHSTIPFPSELAALVREAVKSSAEIEDTEYESLSLALEDWFDEPLADLPHELEKRVRLCLFPFVWDEMSSKDRRSVVEQWDDQHNPDTEKNRQQWWEYFEKRDSIQQKIEEWESIPTLNAEQLAIKESRLAELRRQLADMTSPDEPLPKRDSRIIAKSSERAKPTNTGESTGVEKRLVVSDCISPPSYRKDDWFLAISAMVSEFVNEFGRCPTQSEAWSRLCNSPPTIYGITTCIDRRERALKMNDSTLSRLAFRGRWNRYTQ